MDSKPFVKAGYLLLLPVYFLLHNYNELFGFIPVLYLLLMGLAIYAVMGMVYLITRKNLFVTWCVLLVLLFWGAWHDLIKSIAGKSFFSKYMLVLPVTLLLVALAIRHFRKKPPAKYLTLVLIILCCMNVVSLFMRINKFQRDSNLLYPNKPISNAYKSCYTADSSKPDIYFLLFDEYAHNRTLQQLWQYDNHDITQWLQQRGFYLPDSSKANYSFTPYSLSSIFNMNYLDKKKGKVHEIAYYMLKAVKSMGDNETMSILQKEHYNIHFAGPFKSSFGNLEVYGHFNHFAEKKLLNQTFPGRIWGDFNWILKKPSKEYLDQHRSESQKKFTTLDREYEVIFNRIKSTVNDSAGRAPQFVYGHSMIPHMPHIYDSLGHVRTIDDMIRRPKEFDSYISQVRKSNEKIKELVTLIQSRNRKNTVIIIMGDHGFRRVPPEQNDLLFPNFCAFYFPNKSYTQVPSNMSAVNTFRIVFNQYFCQNLKLLKDSSIIVNY